MGKKNILKKIRDWFTPKNDDEKKKEAQRVSNYGGGVSTKSTQAEVKKSIDKAEAKKEKQTTQKSQTTSSTAFKATPPSVRKAEEKTEKKASTGTKSNAFKATPPAFKRHSTALGTLSTKEENALVARKAMAEADKTMRNYKASKLEPLIKSKYGGATQESKIARKQGEWAYDPNVAKYDVLKHPVLESTGRGLTSGATFGLSELGAALLPRNNGMDEAEQVYQKYKNKLAEGVGELAGGLAGFGATGDLSKMALEKVAPNLTSRAGAWATEKVAASKLVQGAARREALRELGANATKQEIEYLAKKKAAKLVAALGEDAAINMTTGVVSDVSHAIVDSDNPAEFLKNMGLNIAGNVVLGGAVSAVPAVRGSNADDLFIRSRQMAREGLADFADDVTHTSMAGDFIPSKRTMPKIGESIEDRIARIDAERLGKQDVSDIVARYPDIEDQYLDYDGTIEAVNRYFNPDETAEAAVDRYHDLDIQRAKPKPEVKAEEPKAELPPKAEEPKAEAPKKNKKSKKPQTREEMLAESNGLDNYNQRADHQAQRFQEGYEKADNVRAVLNGEEPKATPPTAKAEAPKAEAPRGETKTINLDEKVGKKRVQTSMRDKIGDFVSSFKTKISDSLDAFERENYKLVRTDHEKWLNNNGAIDKFRRHNSIAGRSLAENQLRWNQQPYSGKVVRNGIEIENGKSLKQIFGDMDEATEKEFDKYLILKHAPDRINAKKPIFAGTQYDDPRICLAEADEILKRHPEFAQKSEELYQYMENELQNRVDAGLISQDVVDSWHEKYPNYVPTGRDGDFGGEYDIWDLEGQLKDTGNTVGAGEIKKAEGGFQDIRSIKEQLADATNRNWRDMTMNDMFTRMFGDRLAAAPEASNAIEGVLDNTVNLRKSGDGRKYFAEVFENGEKRRVEIDKRFYDAIEDMYKNGRMGNALFDVPTEVMSKFSTPFKHLVTSWNPIFMVKNGMRDMSEAIINTRNTKEFLSILGSGDALDDLVTNGEFTQALKNSGVSQANFINLEEALVKDKGGVLGVLGKGANKFAELQDMVETYPRLIEFMATIRKAGYKSLKDIPPNEYMQLIDRAAYNAADVTVNFGRSGSVGKMLNRGLVPFFNPSVQGWSKFVRNFSEQPNVKSLLGLIVKAGALGGGATAINNALLSDNPNYQQISARDKATNYIIPVAKVGWADQSGVPNSVPLLPLKSDRDFSEADTFIKIPKSRFAATYGLPMVNAKNENKMGWAEMLKVAKDQVFIVDPVESSIFAPFLDARDNKTWYGTPIVPQAIENKTNPSQEYDANTSPLAVAAGKATSKLPTEFQISPKKLDYILDAETGVIGDFALPMSVAARNGNSIKEAGLNVAKKAFTIDSVTQNNLSSRFYDELQKATDNNTGGETEKAEFDRMNSYSTQISGINKAIKELQNGNLKMNQENIRELQKVRNELYNDALGGKDVPSSSKVMDAVQEHVGTTYAVDNFGSATDQKAMKAYGKNKYGDISDEKMKQKIDSDPDFYKGVQSIHSVDDKMSDAGIESNGGLTKAIALADADASDELFGAYGCTNQSRTESANKMERAKTYMKDGGSVDEYVKLEKTLKTVSRKTSDEKDSEIEELDNQLANGEITQEEYNSKVNELGYNPNTSYIGKATSLAQANCPERGYRLYDIKDKNIQKGINLAAMGISASDYRAMTKEMDADGNGYLKVAEIKAYVANSNFEDKATLYDAFYHYNGSYNPFGTPKKYSRKQAADEGKKQGVEWITDERGDVEVNPEQISGSGYGGYYRHGRWHRYGRRGSGKAASSSSKQAFKAQKINVKGGASLPTRRSSSGSSSGSSSRTSYTSSSSGTSSSVSIPKAKKAQYKTVTLKTAVPSKSGTKSTPVKYETAKAISLPKKKKKTTAKATPPKVKFKKYEV